MKENVQSGAHQWNWELGQATAGKLPSGLYLLQVQGEQFSEAVRISIER
jgi:hypothetical protein